MKKLKLISNIILAIQIYAAIFFPFWLVLSAVFPPSAIINPFIISDINCFRILNIYGTYVTIPLAVSGIALRIIWLCKVKPATKAVIISIILILVHISTSYFNFMIYCYNY